VQENPALERLFEQEQEQAIVQMNLNAKNYTEVAEPMSNIYGALYSTLATDENSQRKSMYYIGSCIGRVFYLLDKAGRVADDKRAERYNVYLVNGVEDPDAALENARRQSLAAANDLVRAYGMLDVKLKKSLIGQYYDPGPAPCGGAAGPGEPARALGAAVKARKSWAMAYCGMAAALSVPRCCWGVWWPVAVVFNWSAPAVGRASSVVVVATTYVVVACTSTSRNASVVVVRRP